MLTSMRRVDYYCRNNHRLVFIHEVNRKNIPQSPSPTVCGCGQVYWLALMGRSASPNPCLLPRLNCIPETLRLYRAGVTQALGDQGG